MAVVDFVAEKVGQFLQIVSSGAVHGAANIFEFMKDSFTPEQLQKHEYKGREIPYVVYDAYQKGELSQERMDQLLKAVKEQEAQSKEQKFIVIGLGVAALLVLVRLFK